MPFQANGPVSISTLTLSMQYVLFVYFRLL